MKWTNNLNLPQPVFDAIANDDYSKGEADYSISELVQPSQITLLKQKHYDEIVEDISDHIYALLGKSVHSILEKTVKNDLSALSEKRLFLNWNGIRISGQIDYLHLFTGILSDYKVMSVWEFIHSLSVEKIYQLNLYDLLLREHDYKISQLKIVGIFRDWQQSKAKFEQNYPLRQVLQIPVSKATQAEQETYLNHRLEILKQGGIPCSDKDRWHRSDKYAVKKKNQKKALRVLDSMGDAEAWMSEIGGDEIEFRPGLDIRCEGYCVVNKFCQQYKNLKEKQDE